MSFGLFVLTRFLVAIANVAMAAISIDLYRKALEAPSAILRLVLFPFLVWRVALARGARTPGLGQISAQVWTGQSGVLGLVLLFAAVSLLPE